jgi:hypothetical protein
VAVITGVFAEFGSFLAFCTFILPFYFFNPAFQEHFFSVACRRRDNLVSIAKQGSGLGSAEPGNFHSSKDVDKQAVNAFFGRRVH